VSAQAPLGARNVVVTGGGTGIGRAIAERIVQGGGRVVLVGRRADVLADVVRAHPDSMHALTCDLADVAARQGLLVRARALLGALDGVVHAAGVVVHEAPGFISERALRDQLELNLVAPLRLVEDAHTQLDDGGAIVLIASTLAHAPVSTSAVYSASKAGMIALAKTWAPTLAARGVRINTISPGVVDTDMMKGRDLDALRALHPLGRVGTPADIAETAWHLLTSSWTTGTDVVVDGGLLANHP
jgi:NAD(P)-dependent dehydrogenase (short-subunit alcohol dehydrogenase family)